jgi:hypothetical protein
VVVIVGGASAVQCTGRARALHADTHAGFGRQAASPHTPTAAAATVLADKPPIPSWHPPSLPPSCTRRSHKTHLAKARQLEGPPRRSLPIAALGRRHFPPPLFLVKLTAGPLCTPPSPPQSCWGGPLSLLCVLGCVCVYVSKGKMASM